jgi:hypothetical protein
MRETAASKFTESELQEHEGYGHRDQRVKAGQRKAKPPGGRSLMTRWKTSFQRPALVMKPTCFAMRKKTASFRKRQTESSLSSRGILGPDFREEDEEQRGRAAGTRAGTTNGPGIGKCLPTG